MSLSLLNAIRQNAGPRRTEGLPDDVVARFLDHDPSLGRAIEEAHRRFLELQAEFGPLLAGPEPELVAALQADFINFYESHAVNPYVPIAARGPWMVTSHGAVLHDSGGYGMLGFGHSPDAVMAELGKPWVVANIMTASFSQRRFSTALRREIGHTRGACPFKAFLCMNSGSEAVTVGARISDVNAGILTGEGGRHHGAKICFLAIEGGFHGRTDRPAQASGSTQRYYRQFLASFRGRDNLVLVPPNDVAALEAAFERARRDNVFFELMLVEPVMGEGNPGMALSRAFYDRARALTQEVGTLLLVDSIQAGLRATGALSLVDYPGFEDAAPPDLETYSKALNAAQYPLSVLAMSEHAAGLYRCGVYGNTMTANPRALEVGRATLAEITPGVRRNIRERGEELKAKLVALGEEFPGLVQQVQGTGLLVSTSLDERVPVVGSGGIEAWCRLHGLGVIHGGKNALRFTPHFRITSEEIDLIVDVLRRAYAHYAGHLERSAAE